jgi:hypothetical protein
LPMPKAHGPDLYPLPNRSVRVRNAGAGPRRALAKLDLDLSNFCPTADGLFQPIPSGHQPDGPDEYASPHRRSSVAGGLDTHRPQAQHRARTLEYPNPGSESTKRRTAHTERRA